MNRWRHLVSLGIVLAVAGGTMTASATGETTPDPQPAASATASREPVLGVGYHPGNFVGSLAFDLIVRPLRHFALDAQVGYWQRPTRDRAWSSPSDCRSLPHSPLDGDAHPLCRARPVTRG